jgi:hypothetical protein
VRATTALNRLLALTGARAIDVRFGSEGITVLVALRCRRLVCSRCGQVDRASWCSGRVVGEVHRGRVDDDAGAAEVGG